MGEPRVPSLNPSESIVLWEHYRLWGGEGFKGVSHYAERRSLSDSKCWNGGNKWDKLGSNIGVDRFLFAVQ